MNFIEIPNHGYTGDFYACNGGAAYRADNLDIATQLAFNNWLFNFDRLYRSCSLISIEPGWFGVKISSHSTRSGVVLSTETREFSVKYVGPANMFEANYKAATFSDEEIGHYIDVMRNAAIAGNPNVRLSKGGANPTNKGLPLFACRFPRWRENGDWWPSESMHLAYDDATLAREQMIYAGLIEGAS